MSHKLISRSPDLKKLRDAGYAIEVKGGYLVTHHIPYVNSNRQIVYGTLVSELTLSGNKTAKPNNHVIHFIGEHPCNKDGTPMTGLVNQQVNTTLLHDLTANYILSNKPRDGYTDYFHKISQYIKVISAPANSLDNSVTALAFKPIPEENDDGVFKYIDTNESRAEICEINSKLKRQKIAIIGLGGSGAYVLDFVAKCPVEAIHLFDGDLFQQHNAFRSPGAASLQQLEDELMKTDYYAMVYSNMHKQVVSHACYVTEENLSERDIMSYVFIAIDKSPARRIIINYLLQKGIPFIDLGLGVNIAEGNLVGTLRMTSGTASKNDHLFLRVPSADDTNNEYDTNIQIAELNALTANLAVIKWKKMCGFYQDIKQEHHITYSINVSQLRNEDLAI